MIDFDWNDPLGFDAALTPEERALTKRARRFSETELATRVKSDFLSGRTDPDLFRKLGSAGLLGVTESPELGGAGAGYVSYGLIARELERVDSGYRTMMSVQSSLVIYPIAAFGSAEQKEKFLPSLIAGEAIGCFGLTEPSSGSDPASMETIATQDGEGYLLTGRKTWISNSPLADVFLVWAKSAAHGGKIRGFLLEKGAPGLYAPRIDGKLSLLVCETGEIVMEGVKVGPEALLPGSSGMRGPFECLNRARLGIAFGAIGAAEDCWHAARDYGLRRLQFGRPLAQTQLWQRKLTDMQTEIALGLHAALRAGRLFDQRQLPAEAISLIKRNSAGKALTIAREARDMLGGNGIQIDYRVMRHAVNLEAVNTYEGTHDVHALILGRAQTGLQAFA